MANIDKKLLRMHKTKKIKYVEKPMFGGKLKHPTTKKPIKVTVLNLPISQQIQYAKLYRKGFITGNFLGKGNLTKKGIMFLKKIKR